MFNRSFASALIAILRANKLATKIDATLFPSLESIFILNTLVLLISKKTGTYYNFPTTRPIWSILFCTRDRSMRTNNYHSHYNPWAFDDQSIYPIRQTLLCFRLKAQVLVSDTRMIAHRRFMNIFHITHHPSKGIICTYNFRSVTQPMAWLADNLLWQE